MDIEKVIQELQRRFAAPLPEYYHRRIIFWQDEDREFEDKLDEIQLNNAKIVALTGNNTFMVKKLLGSDDQTSNYLVYNPLSFDKPDDDWLMDVKLYSEEFRADLLSMWMDEMGLPSGFAMRKQVKHYRKFFNAMRYEVAAALAEDLQRVNQSQVKLDNMQSIFPSITKFGMAALLPHSKLTAERKGDILAVLADGQSTASANRDKVLKAANPASVALQYKNIRGVPDRYCLCGG